MKKDDAEQKNASYLRKQAEKRLKAKTTPIERLSDEEVRRLAHELQVHQIELEMQNDELRNAQLEIEESRRKYTALYDYAPVGYFTTSEKGIILEVNLTGSSMLQIERGSLVNKPLSDFIAGEDQDKYYLYRNHIHEKNERKTCELKMVRNDGEQFYAQLESVALRYNDGNLNHIRSIVTDITERKLAEEELVRSEGKYRNLIETAQDAIVCDENQVVTDWNKSAERIFGYTKQEIIGQPISALIPEKYREEHDKGVERYLKTGKAEIIGKTVEVSGITKEGKEVPLEISIAHQKSGSERNSFIAIIRDILGRKRVVNALQRSEKEYRTLVQTISDIIYKLDRKGCFVFVNDAIKRLGYEPEELVGKHFSTILHPDDAASFTGFDAIHEKEDKKSVRKEVLTVLDERRVKDRSALDMEIRLVSKIKGADAKGICFPGTFYCEVTSYEDYVADTDGRRRFMGTSGIIKDNTEKIKLQADAVRSTQLAMVGELAAGAAHEINNPIYGIMNYAQLIVDESVKGSRAYRFGSLIIKESERVADLTRRLLSFSRSATTKRRSVPIPEIVSASLDLVRAQLEKDKIIVKEYFADDIPLITVNFQEIQQVFLNLIQNSRYALNEKYRSKDEDKILEISCDTVLRDHCRYVRIVFYDRGNGIPEEVLSKVTNPFFTTKPPAGGTGIGLSISQHIINAHDATMTIESRQGEFTRITIDMPENSRQ